MLKRLYHTSRRLLLAMLTAAWAIAYAPVAEAAGASPQQLISSLNVSLRGVKPKIVDSLKTMLSQKYVEDYRTYGMEVAYDSLRHRVHVIAAANEHNRADTLVTNSNVEKPLSELDRLKKENQTLKNELKQLKEGPRKPPEPTQLEKRTLWIVRQLTEQNSAAADTLWKVHKDNTFGLTPLYVDSFTHEAYEPFMTQTPPAGHSLKKPRKEKGLRADTLILRNHIRHKIRQKMLLGVIARDPAAIRYYNLDDYEDMAAMMMKKNEEVGHLEVTGLDLGLIDIDKPKTGHASNEPWTSLGKLSLQFSQYYVSDNWYKGGEPNATLLGTFSYEHNYKQGHNIWDNSLDMKLGFYTTQNDTIRAFRVNNDLFKLSSTVGHETFFSPKWFYAANIEVNTQFFRNYKATNSEVIKASFLSPTRLFVSLGFKYELNKNVYAYLSPMAYKLIFLVNDDIEDPKTVGISSGKSQNDFGFFGKGKVRWKFTKDIGVNSTFDIFAPYSFRNVEFNWETEGNFVINRFLSTKLSLNMRFDSTPTSADYESPKLQIQEMLSLAFNYRFR